jgi:hypothetical protein
MQQTNQTPPVARVLRILLGLALIVYTVPVYFQVPTRIAVGAWLLVLGLIGVYSLIHIVVSRRMITLARALGRLWRMDYSSRCMLEALPGYRFLAVERSARSGYLSRCLVGAVGSEPVKILSQ